MFRTATEVQLEDDLSRDGVWFDGAMKGHTVASCSSFIGNALPAVKMLELPDGETP